MAVSSQDAHPFPIYNARFRLIVPLLDADGDPVSPSSPDTELSQDMGTFADATNEATEIATSSGIVYVDLIATEMDTTSTVVKIASTGAKTTIAVLNPRRLPIIRTGTAQAGAATTITLDSNASAIDDYYVGCYVNITNDTPANARGQARVITDYVGSTKVATVATYGTNPSSSSTFEILATPDWIQRLSDVNAISGVAVSTSTAQLGVNVVNVGGSAVSQSGGLLNANVTQISSDATAADNAEAFFDGTGYAGTGNTIPTVTTVTNQVTANVTAISGDSAAADNLESYTDGTTPMPVNVTQVSGDSTAADNAESFFDGTGYAGTNNVIPLVTTVTNLTNAATAGDLTATMKASINTEADTALTDYGALKPTTAGRTLDVTATGGAGIDWANVENPTTAVNLSATNIDVDQVVASVTGAVGSVTGAVGSVTAQVSADVTAISGDATAANNAESFFDGTGYAGTGNTIPTVTTITNQVTANVTAISGDSAAADYLEMWLDGFITGTAQSGDVTYIQLAAGESSVDDIYNGYRVRIMSGTGAGQTRVGTIYTGATKNLEVFPSFDTAPDNTSIYLLVPYGVVNANVTGVRHVTDRANYLGTLLENYNTDGWLKSNPVAINGDTGAAANLESLLDGAGGTLTGDLTGSVGLLNALDQNALAQFFTDDSGQTYGTSVAGSVVKEIADNAGGTPPTAAAIADAVWDETLADHLTAGSTGNALNAAGSAGDPWSTALPGAYGAGSAGKIIGDNLNATVSSRASQTSLDAAIPAGGIADADKLLGYVQLLARADSEINTDRSAEFAEINADEGNGAGNFDNVTDSHEAIRNQETVIASRLPTSLVSGRMAADVIAISGDTTAADNAESFFDGTGYAGTNNVIPTVTSVTAIATGGITAGSIAADAIGASELAADAVAEIQSGLATAANLATLTAYVDTEVAAILEDTGTTIPAQIAALNNLSAAQVNTEVDTALTDIHLDHLLATDYDPANKPGVATALLNELIGSDAGVSQFTVNALELAPSGGGGGSTAADIWAYATRTLTTPLASVESTVTNTTVTMYRGDVFNQAFTGLGALGTWTKVYLTIKKSDVRDEQANVQIMLTNPSGIGDGLTRLNARSATLAWASITVDDANAGDITVFLDESATRALEPGEYDFDIQYVNSAGSSTRAAGTWTVNGDVTRAIS